MNGYIYAMSCHDIQGLKIGFTTDWPSERAKQITRREKTKQPFRVEYAARVKNCYRAEKTVHTLLTSDRIVREFFNVTVDEFQKIVHWNFRAVDERKEREKDALGIFAAARP